LSEPSPNFVSTSWTCVGSGVECPPSGTGALEDFVSFLPAGASVTYTISATVGSELPETIDYLVGVIGVNSSREAAGPQSPAGSVLNCLPVDCAVLSSLPSGSGLPAQMSITKTADQTSLVAGGSVRYTVDLANV